MRKAGFILQLKIDRNFATFRTGQFPFPDESLIAERSKFIHAEVSEKQIAFVDNVAFLKGNIDNVTADPRGYRDQLDRCGSSGELVPVHHLLLFRFADRNLGRWWTMRRRLLVVAAGQPKT